jgi:hypothetical protein
MMQIKPVASASPDGSRPCHPLSPLDLRTQASRQIINLRRDARLNNNGFMRRDSRGRSNRRRIFREAIRLTMR